MKHYLYALLHKKELIIFLGIILISIILRFYLLGANPTSLDWDEASMGYNAYSLFHTGADEYGNKLPLEIRSFDDYKPPVYTYLTIPSVALFGLTSFAVRLPAAVFGVMAILGVYLFVKGLVSKLSGKGMSGKLKEYMPLASAFFLAISPWHIQFSRAAFEGNLGVCFLCFALYFFLKGLDKRWFLFISVPFFVLCMYSYHSFRLVVPIAFFVLGFFFWKDLLNKKFSVIISLFIIAALCFPIFQTFFVPTAGSQARLSMVTIFGNSEFLQPSITNLEKSRAEHNMMGEVMNNRRIVYTAAIIKGYFDHFSPDFLFIEGDGGRQHHVTNMGMLYLWDLPMLFIGLLTLFLLKDKRLFLIIIFILLAPLPASITTGTPHPVRAIGMLPFLQILISLGFLSSLWYLWQKKNIFLKYGITIIIVTLLLTNFIFYIYQYYIVTPRVFAVFWQYGYKEAYAKVSELEKNNDKIIFTYHYDQPYIYYLFFNKVDPSWYQKHWNINKTGHLDRMYRVIGKYEFRNIDWNKDSQRKKTIIVAGPNEIPASIKDVDDIKFPDGKIAFRIVAL